MKTPHASIGTTSTRPSKSKSFRIGSTGSSSSFSFVSSLLSRYRRFTWRSCTTSRRGIIRTLSHWCVSPSAYAQRQIAPLACLSYPLLCMKSRRDDHSPHRKATWLLFLLLSFTLTVLLIPGALHILSCQPGSPPTVYEYFWLVQYSRVGTVTIAWLVSAAVRRGPRQCLVDADGAHSPHLVTDKDNCSILQLFTLGYVSEIVVWLTHSAGL